MHHAGLRAGAARPHVGVQTASDPAKQNYVAVCALADKLFGRIREMVASQLVPMTLKVVLSIALVIISSRTVAQVPSKDLQLQWCCAVSMVCTMAQVALVEPLSAQLGVELGTSLFACKDEVFMSMFTGICLTHISCRSACCRVMGLAAMLTTAVRAVSCKCCARCRGGATAGGAPRRPSTAVGGLGEVQRRVWRTRTLPVVAS